MTIRINQIDVNFTLEEETTFADLTASLRAWALGQNLAVLGILADGKALAPEDPAPLDRIALVEVEAVPAGDRDLARVAVVSRYFALLARGLAAGDAPLVRELQGEFPGVKDAAAALLAVLGPRVSGALGAFDGPWDRPEDLKGPAALLAELSEERRRELQNPGQALADSLGRLDGVLADLEDLGLLFQRGEDRTGFARILDLLAVLEDLGRRTPLALGAGGLDQGPWESFQEGLRPLLQEAEGALAAGDFILLTDLLEYEITPRMKEIRGLFPGSMNLDPATGVL